MEVITYNAGAKVRKETVNGRSYLVAPMRMIVSGVLNGSQGKLFYPGDEVVKDPSAWNGMPIVVNHPTKDGRAVSARHPDIMAESEIGRVYNAVGKENKFLDSEGWFDEEYTSRVSPETLKKLQRNEQVELSTGLFTDNTKAPAGSNHNGTPYDYVARNYRPDHLAVLPTQKGACSIVHGCGVLVNEYNDVPIIKNMMDEVTANRDWPQSKRDKTPSKDFAGPGESFPITSQADVDAAAHLVGKAADPEAVKSRIKAIAKKRGFSLPDAWKDDQPTGNVKDKSMYNVVNASSMMKEADVASDTACDASSTAKNSGSKDDHVDAAKAHLDASKAHKDVATDSKASGSQVKAQMMAKAHGAMADSHMDKARYSGSPGYPTDNKETPTFDRTATVNFLTTNCSCWKGEGDAAILNTLPDEKLKLLEEAAKGKPSTYVPVPTPTDNQTPVINTQEIKTVATMEEWMTSAPPEVRAAVQNSINITNEAKSRIVDRLVANVAKDKQQVHIDYLMKKDLNELKMELERMPVANHQGSSNGYVPQSNGYVPVPSYVGASGGAVYNAQQTQTDDDILDIPVINWEENYDNGTNKKIA